MKHKNILLGAMALATLIFAAPNPAAAEVNVYFNNGPSCQNYTRTYTDYRGYEHVANGTACLQGGVWRVVSENQDRVIAPRYYRSQVGYNSGPVVYARPGFIYRNTPGVIFVDHHFDRRGHDRDRSDWNRHHDNRRGHDRDRDHRR